MFYLFYVHIHTCMYNVPHPQLFALTFTFIHLWSCWGSQHSLICAHVHTSDQVLPQWFWHAVACMMLMPMPNHFHICTLVLRLTVHDALLVGQHKWSCTCIGHRVNCRILSHLDVTWSMEGKAGLGASLILNGAGYILHLLFFLTLLLASFLLTFTCYFWLPCHTTGGPILGCGVLVWPTSCTCQ